MSETTKAITDQHLRYLAAHTAPEDDFLASLRRGATSAGLPAIAIAAAQGSLMQILLRLARARVVIEVGTLGGYSAIWMARALPPDGHVHTVEVEPRHADFAAAWIAKSDVADSITQRRRRLAKPAVVPVGLSPFLRQLGFLICSLKAFSSACNREAGLPAGEAAHQA